jgi:hypothetical protein
MLWLAAAQTWAGQALTRHVPPDIAGLKLQAIGQVPDNSPVNLALSLPLRNQPALDLLLRQLYDPTSTNFHRYLTPRQFTEKFEPSLADYQAVMDFAQSNGLKVTGQHLNRMMVDVSGPALAVENAFHMKLLTYHHPTEGRDFFAPNAEPSFDLAAPILHIGGLDNYESPQSLVNLNGESATAEFGSGTNGSYMGEDFRAAYAPNVVLTGTGQTVGLLEFDGYYTSDITNYESQAGLPNVGLTNVLIDGFNGVPVNYDANVEVSLDIEMAISMAPGATQVVVYEAGPNGNWDDTINRMADDDLAGQMSSSWFLRDGQPDPVADQIYQQMAAQGQTMFQASGDYDAWTALIPFPCDNPYLTLVGGTQLSTTGPGGAWSSETVWNTNGGGSGGGGSTSYAIPSWQQGVNMGANQGSTTMRNVPDVALTAFNVYVMAGQGTPFVVAGTSCAAPLWAGFTALVNEQAAASYLAPVGFLNPALYQLGLGTNYQAAMHDIVTGNNTNRASPAKFFAEPGYDLCTGWGTPSGQNLIDALTQAYQPGPPVIVMQPQNQTVPYNGSATFFVQATGTFPLSFQWQFNGSSIGNATNVRLVLDSVESAQNGSYDVLISNSVSNVVSSNAVLTVEPPQPPVITSQPVGAEIPVGGSAMFSVSAGGTPPLSYQWTLNNANLPGATNDSLVLTNVQISQAGLYAAQVSNVVNTITSSNAALALFPGWQPGAAPATNWSAVACSADGTRMYATVARGFIYASTNSGGTWSQSGAVSNFWACVASSSDGVKLIAAEAPGFVYTSANSGGVWHKNNLSSNGWATVTISTNGDYLLAVKKTGSEVGTAVLNYSSNSGTNWSGTDIGNIECPQSWSGAAASANGLNLVATLDDGPIYVSTDGGAQWTKTGAPTNEWSAVASSSDGTKLVAVAHTGGPGCEQSLQGTYTGPIYTSTDSGNTWTEQNAPSNYWTGVASSSDGTKLVAVSRNGPIYTSSDSGVTWADSGAPTNDWTSVASSADGNTLVAVAGSGGGIYTWQTEPALNFAATNNNLSFSWLGYWNGAILMQNTNLTATNWTATTNTTLSNNGYIRTTIAPTNVNNFYKLSYP